MLQGFRGWLVLGVAVVAIAISSVAEAQQGQGPGGGRGPGSPRGPGGPRRGGPPMGSMAPGGGPMMSGDPTMMILRSDKIQKELELTDDQITQLKAIQEKMRTAIGDLRDLPPEERMAKIKEMQEKNKAQVEGEILLPDQVDRLKQLSIQVRGPNAIFDPNVMKELGLSDAQKTKLNSIREHMENERKSLFSGMSNMRNMSSEDRRAHFTEIQTKMQKLSKDTTEQAQSVLTPDQKAKLEKLQGQKFDFGGMQSGGPGGPGRGPGGPGRGPGGPGRGPGGPGRGPGSGGPGRGFGPPST